MKPKKRIFCPFIGRAKMLFESREKAENFIKYNSSEIRENGGCVPIRAYYCGGCGGWHITSMKGGRSHSASSGALYNDGSEFIRKYGSRKKRYH